MARDQSDLLQGTLELMILKTLSLEPMHGWGITQRIQQTSRDVFQINQGSLYPALQRLATRGLISAEGRMTENKRQARYYMLTSAGESELARELAQWQRASSAVNWVLGWTGGAA